MPAIIDKILRLGEGKILRQLEGVARAVNAIEDDFVAMSDDELRGMTDELKKRHADGESLDDLPEGAVVLTGALRRKAQILMRRPDLRVEPLRGNVDTRLRKWRESGAGGVILAGAGLDRLGLRDLPAHRIPTDVLIPAPGQGTLALEVRTGGPAETLCRALDHPPSGRAAVAERRVVAAFGGNCTLPLAAWARPENGALRLTALLATPDGRHAAGGEAVGNEPEEVADACVAALRENGADEVLARIRG